MAYDICDEFNVAFVTVTVTGKHNHHIITHDNTYHNTFNVTHWIYDRV